MEQSPAEDSAVSQLGPPCHRLGTIVGEAFCTTSSTTMVQAPPPGVLSFREQTVCTRTTLHTDPERPPKPESPCPARSDPFRILEDPDEAGQDPDSMSPEGTLQPDWLDIRSPEAPPETDLDAFLSPCRLKMADVPMSPAMAPPMDATASPDRGQGSDVSMSSATPTSRSGPLLMSNPWNDELISRMLSTLTPPLSSHPQCTTWSFSVPAISPRMTITMGTAAPAVTSLPWSAFNRLLGYRKGVFTSGRRPRSRSLRHRVSGHQPRHLREDGAEGKRGRSQGMGPAGAQVFSVSPLWLQLQKPANPWEFYINTQLDARLQPATRHLYSNIRAAHLFTDGSVLLAELHKYGTLLVRIS